MTQLSSILQLLGAIILFVGVLAATYFTTRWIARYQQGSLANKNIRVIETLKLTPGKYVQIVRAGEQYLVLGISKENITVLATLGEEEILDPGPVAGAVMDVDFGEILEKLKKRIQKK